MIAQIIFFIALALFIILLVRRFQATPALWQRLSSFFSQFGQMLRGAGSKVGSQVARRASQARRNIPLLGERKPTATTFSPPLASSGDKVSEDFWQEGSAQAEVPSFFDEGDEHFKKGEYEQAEEFFLKAATRNPTDARVYARLGIIYLHNQNYNDAIEALKVAVKHDRYNPSRHYNLALAYHGHKDNQKAISSVREAIALDPVTKKYRVLLEQLLERK